MEGHEAPVIPELGCGGFVVFNKGVFGEAMTQRLKLAIVAIAIPIIFASCGSFGTTSPNISIIDHGYASQSDSQVAEAQAVLETMALKNNLLALELGKLPELQDGIDRTELDALRVIQKVYLKQPKAFNDAFAEMYKVGKPGVRRYCSLLQALFWLAEDGYLSYEAEILERYTLKRLLQLSWSINKRVSASDVFKIIHGYRDEEDRNAWIKDFSETPVDEMAGYILQGYQLSPEQFTDETKKYIEKILKNKDEDPRWTDFRIVTERLNAPELVDYYLGPAHSIMYKFDHRTCQSPRHTFKRKKGCCVCVAYFAGYCLDNAGYETFVRHLRGSMRQHGVLVAKVDGKFLIAVDYTGRNNMHGPYENISDVDDQIERFIGGSVYLRRYLKKPY